ncbi:MAG: hypothetical protein COB12_09275 [Flavobacterium sp.]|nr:MAG: hypothetical protein COB12_09275 [Flavobacterium sp.]
MKAIKTVFIVLFVLVMSCEKQDSSKIELDSNFTFKSLTNNKIGIEKDGKFTLNVINDEVMDAFKKFSLKNGLDLKPLSFKVITIDENNYLRFYNEDDQVSTIVLIKGDNGHYKTGGTVCTSTVCSSGGGCIPNGLYCTPCKPFGPDGPTSSDCKRVTSNEN